MTTTPLDLLRAAVRAKQLYWDAVHAVEDALVVGSTISDQQVIRIHDWVDLFAAGGGADDITDEHVQGLLEGLA